LGAAGQQRLEQGQQAMLAGQEEQRQYSRESNMHFETIRRQLDQLLQNQNSEGLAQLVIANPVAARKAMEEGQNVSVFILNDMTWPHAPKVHNRIRTHTRCRTIPC
jgi:hypothetical protein